MKSLSGRQTKFALGIVSGLSAAQSAREAGYGLAYAAKAAEKLLPQPPIAALIEEGQAELRGKTMFGLEQAVKECDSLITFALSNRNPMAASKTLELKCKLHGLLIERVQVTDFVDIGSALLEARQRSYGPPIHIASTAVTVPEQQTHIAHDHIAGDIFS